ncbi:hypothetical protein D3C85_1120000 [compost metagenome]
MYCRRVRWPWQADAHGEPSRAASWRHIRIRRFKDLSHEHIVIRRRGKHRPTPLAGRDRRWSCHLFGRDNGNAPRRPPDPDRRCSGHVHGNGRADDFPACAACRVVRDAGGDRIRRHGSAQDSVRVAGPAGDRQYGFSTRTQLGLDAGRPSPGRLLHGGHMGHSRWLGCSARSRPRHRPGNLHHLRRRGGGIRAGSATRGADR